MSRLIFKNLMKFAFWSMVVFMIFTFIHINIASAFECCNEIEVFSLKYIK